MCSPGEKESPVGTFSTSVMRSPRFPPSWPMVQSALPRQFMPRAMTEGAPNRMERKALGRIVDGFGPEAGRQDERNKLCYTAVEDSGCSPNTASGTAGQQGEAVIGIFIPLDYGPDGSVQWERFNTGRRRHRQEEAQTRADLNSWRLE